MAYQLQPIALNIVKVEFIKEITDADADRYLEEITPYLDQATPHNPLHLLVYAQNVGKVSGKARQVFTDLNRNPGAGKLAVFGLNRTLKVLAVFMNKASGRQNIRVFDDETEALAWLQTY